MEQKTRKYQFKFINFEKAFLLLRDRVEILKKDPDNELIQAAIIQTFEFTFELSWKLIKAFLEYKGVDCQPYPRDIIKAAFQNGLIANGDVWIEALGDSNKTSHTYNGDFSRQMTTRILQEYMTIFEELYNEIKKEYE